MWIKSPQSIPKYIRVAYISIRNGGIKKLINDIFRGYLPKKYLLKTKIHIKEPSSSIFSKIRTYQSEYLSILAKKNPHQVSTNFSILIIRSGAMGDVLLATPILKMLNHKYDGLCQITFATRYPEILKNNPYIFKILTLRELKSLENSYDLILNLDSCYEKNRFMHITLAYSFLAFGATFNTQFLQPELYLSSHDEEVVQTFLNQIGGQYIVSHNRLDPSQPYRNIPIKDWKYLISELISRTGLKILQIGDKKLDISLTDSDSHLIDIRGKFTPQQSKGIIASAALFLGTDAGPLHIAACTQTPIVSFFSIAHHEVRKPLRTAEATFTAVTPKVECYGCQNQFQFNSQWQCKRGDFACTSKFNIEEALSACLNQIKRG
jgi:ADP-heptose:LPS heptosyltransferase